MSVSKNNKPAQLSSREQKKKKHTHEIPADIWLNPAIYTSPPRKSRGDDDWGDYAFFLRKIWLHNGAPNVHIGYYRRLPEESTWIFGASYSIEENPKIIKRLCELVIRRREWFTEDSP